MKRYLALFAGLALTGMFATSADAQPALLEPYRPASIGVLGGLSAGSGDTGGTVGLNLAFDVTDRLGVEARGLATGRHMASMGFEATGTMLFTVANTPKAAPYVAVGGGAYRASFDLDRDAMFGAVGSQFGSGTMMTSIQGTSGFMRGNGTVFNGSRMPAFYANRLGQMTVPGNGRWGMRSFTDPALTVGGGVRLDVTERFYVRPDVRALVVLGNGDRLTLMTMTFAVGYRF
jgi:hypothetical protein